MFDANPSPCHHAPGSLREWVRTAEHRNASVPPPRSQPGRNAPRLSARLLLTPRRWSRFGTHAKRVGERFGSQKIRPETYGYKEIEENVEKFGLLSTGETLGYVYHSSFGNSSPISR